MADSTYESVMNYYGKVLQTSQDLKTSACSAGSAPTAEIRAILKHVPSEIKDKYFGCGSPFQMGIQGLTVLDLGSGSGRDCYIVSCLVGEKGRVIGLDMTDEQLDVARKHVQEYCSNALGYAEPNMKFLKGHIEFLEEAGVENNSIDMVISNCVVNLSPDKPRVIQSVFNALKEGGEFFFSDMYADRRVPDEIKKEEVLLGEGLGGALYVEDFKRLCHRIGFRDPRIVSMTPITVFDPTCSNLVGEIKYFSITFRVFKLASLESGPEDYGQVAVYKGTIPGSKHSYTLDEGHAFETDKRVRVSGNTASILQESWLKDHFIVQGDRSRHFGSFI